MESESSDRKKRTAIDDEERFKRTKPFELAIIEDDRISNLPDFQIASLFEYLTYDGLVAMCAVSRKLSLFAWYALLKNTNKERKNRLTLKQKWHGLFCLNTWSPRAEEYYMTMRTRRNYAPHIVKGVGETPKMIVERRQWRAGTQVARAAVPDQIKDAANYLLSRFHFEEVMFETLLFDEDFVSEFEEVFRQSHVRIVKPTLATHFHGLLTTRRLIAQLLPLSVHGISLEEWPVPITGADYEDILGSVAQSSPDTTLHISTNPMLMMMARSQVVVDAVSKIRDIKLRSLKIHETDFVQAMLTRMRNKIVGVVDVGVNTVHQIKDLIALLGNFEFDVTGNVVRARDSTFTANFSNERIRFFYNDK